MFDPLELIWENSYQLGKEELQDEEKLELPRISRGSVRFCGFAEHTFGGKSATSSTVNIEGEFFLLFFIQSTRDSR